VIDTLEPLKQRTRAGFVSNIKRDCDDIRTQLSLCYIRRCRDRPVITTRDSSLSALLAVASPMPELPPSTTTVMPASDIGAPPYEWMVREC
jgi:hypothetical protein